MRHLPALLGIVLLFAAVYGVQREFRHLQLADIGKALHAISARSLQLGFACTVLSYAVLTLYDRLGTIYAGHKVAYRRAAFASFCAYALSHNLGFAAVSGAAVRYRLYANWGFTPVEIGKTVAFCSLTFGLGGMVLGGAILFVEPGAVPFFGDHVPRAVLYAVGAALWAVVAGYVLLAKLLRSFRLRGHEISLPGARMALLQVALATADVAITATIFWVLLPAAPHLTWLVCLGVYVASYSAGLAANLPGGIGVFDSAILFGLAPYLPAPKIVAAIAIFRLYYYVIPLFLAGGLFAGNEVLRGGALLRRTTTPVRPRWSEPDFAVAACTGVVALSGVLLLGASVLAPGADVPWPDPSFARFAREAGQFVPSLIGAALAVMAIGLSQRVNLAWTVTLVLLVAGAAFVAGQGERYWLAGVLAMAALVLAPCRTFFYRPARLLGEPLEASTGLSLLALVVCILALAGFRRRVFWLSHNAWWEIVLSDRIPWTFRASVALAVALGLVAILLLLRPGRVKWRPWDVEARLRLLMLGAQPPAWADGIVWGEAQTAAIPFRRLGPVLLGLGDPAGAAADRISAIWRLRDLARQEGRDPAFWRTGPKFLKVYNDLGLAALALGPDGTPKPEGGGGSEYLVCLAERDLERLLPILRQLAAGQEPSPPARRRLRAKPLRRSGTGTAPSS
ncbi:MAG: phosphatidylglycerol lysyltransferase domain-containing protein [Pseudomonadota bacterium]|nr:phosphatidylglycerol lysyltransferase domain-containing protein [Pseudomonadota bacterium]